MLPAVLSDSSSVATVVIFFVRLVPPLPSRPPSQVKAKPSPVLSWLTCLSDNGKLLDLPKGPISHVQVFGKHLILLNEVKVSFDILEKQSHAYSDRPHLVFCADMVGWKGSMAFMNTGPEHRLHRKNMHQVIGTKALVSNFHHVLTNEAKKFAQNVSVSPEKLYHHIRTVAGAIILLISHGYTIDQDQYGERLDPLVKLAQFAMHVFSRSADAEKWAVNLLPFLQHVPSWPYEPKFKCLAREWKRIVTDVLELPHEFVKHKMASGNYVPSVTSGLLLNNPSKEEEEIIKWTANTIYVADADTTVATVHNFFLAMVLNPGVQRRAQDELDSVLRRSRLPTIENRNSLPYVDAIVKEVLRWVSIVPMGFPHVASEDGSYNGFYMPKEALLISNLWLFAHDTANYHDPDTFKPDRFLGDEPELDPYDFVFGLVGELADALIFIEIATILSIYSIYKYKDAQGVVHEPKANYSTDAVSLLSEFPCDISFRSAQARILLFEDEERSATITSTVSDSEFLQNLQANKTWSY